MSQFAKLSRRFAGTGAAFMLFAHMTLAAESADSIVAPLPPLPASFEAQPVDQPVPDAPGDGPLSEGTMPRQAGAA